MALEGLNTVLSQLKKTHWQDQQSFEKFARLWPEIVGPAVAAQTRPVKLSEQGSLYVSVSTGVWAQNLAFERIRLLKKVNAAWNGTVKDIYFSTREWHRRATPQRLQALELKSVVRSTLKTPAVRSQPLDARDAFSRWSSAVKKQAKGNVTCPLCQCPSPLEELQRWGHCSLCLSRPSLSKNLSKDSSKDLSKE